MALNNEIEDWQWLCDHGYAVFVKENDPFKVAS